MDIISNITNWHIIIGCVVLFIIFAPVAIYSTDKLTKIQEEYQKQLRNEGFCEIPVEKVLIDKVKLLPNFDYTFKNNISEVYKKSTDKYIIYLFIHVTDYGKYSKILKCVLIESKIVQLLPKFTIQPLKLENRFLMRLDQWKAPKIIFDNRMLRSFRIRSDNEEWLKNILEESLQVKFEEYGVGTTAGITYEGCDNLLLAYKQERRISSEIFLKMTNACITLLNGFEQISKRKYRNLHG